ncbi:glycosyltransferase family 2 protein [Paenibacillus campinasensis]|nr:glycosyltransferase family A protein [Paenibacillus campinasensis]
MMNSCGRLISRPGGFTPQDTAAYRQRLLEEALHSRSEWLRWDNGSVLLDRHAEVHFPGKLPGPAEAVCMTLNKTPLYWRRCWLIERLRLWNSRLPAARFLPFDLMPADNQAMLELGAPPPAGMNEEGLTSRRRGHGHRKHSAFLPAGGHPQELGHILPVLQAASAFNAQSIGTADKAGRPPSVSVLMSVHNMQDTLGWSIRSVLAQTMPDWELLVGDDGSTDGSSLEAMFYDDSRIRCFSYTRNRGKASVMRGLLKEARGRYIVELDGDDWLSPEALLQLKTALDENHAAGMATACCGLWIRSRSFGPLWKGTVDSSRWLHPDGNLESADSGAPPLVPRMYRKTALEAVGGWYAREDLLGRIFEDIDLTHRLLRQSPLAWTPGVLYHRVLHGRSISQQHRDLFPLWRKFHS